MPTVADIVVHRLVEAGVRTLFGMPGGGSNLDLIEAAGRAGLPFVMSHTETAGALMACAQAELTGRPGACLSTLGPGVASVVNGAAHAWLDRVPLLVLTDGMAAAGRDTYQHQRLDHCAILGPVTKASITLEAERSDEMICRALAIANGPPAGPVHIDLAPDVSRQSSEMGLGAGARQQGESSSALSPQVTSEDQDRLRTVVAGARRPVVIAGLGARDTRDALALVRLCDKHTIPVLVTYKAKGVMPDELVLFGGVFTNGAIERPLVGQADLIIGVGLDPVELLPRPWEYRAPCVMLSRWPLEQRHIPVAVSIVCDLPEGLRMIDDFLPPTSSWREEEIGPGHRHRDLEIDGSGMAPWRVIRAAEKAAFTFDQFTTVTVDAGAHMFPITWGWPVRRPRQMLISNGLSTMAFALPSAIGAALLDRSRRVFALTGDGGLLMCLAELGTAVREKLPITVVVFNDRSLSLIEIKQEKMGYPRVGVSIDGVDWQAAAAAFGVPAWRATEEMELHGAFEAAAEVAGPVLVEAVVDPSSYPEILRIVRG